MGLEVNAWCGTGRSKSEFSSGTSPWTAPLMVVDPGNLDSEWRFPILKDQQLPEVYRGLDIGEETRDFKTLTIVADPITSVDPGLGVPPLRAGTAVLS